ALVDRGLECTQLEWFVEHPRINATKEKFKRWIVLVPGKKNEAITSRRPGPGDRPIKHLASHFRHHHIANDNVEAALYDLLYALDSPSDRRDFVGKRDQVLAKNALEIVAIFQKQNLRPRRRGFGLICDAKVRSEERRVGKECRSRWS